MKLARPLAILSLSTALAGTQAFAADYFVQAITTGAVTGTPLAVITLQSGGDSTSATEVQPTAIKTETAVAKWISVGKGTKSKRATTTVATGSAATPTSSTTTTTTSQVTQTLAAPSTTGVAVPAGAQLWANFDALMKSGKVTGGDRIFLLDGYHGQIVVRDKQFASTVTIGPAAGAVAHADSVLVMNSTNVHIQGLKVWPRSSTSASAALVRSYANTSNIAFTDLDVRSTATAGNYASWTVTDWNKFMRNGFLVDGTSNVVARNRVTGVFNGIVMLGKNALLEQNIIDGFAGDGMRALGDDSVVRQNKVQNCHQVNASHTDAFQAWTTGPTGQVGTGILRNMIIEDNKIYEFVGTRSPIACKLQGISLFAGVYDNFVIRNNIVSTTAYHGITIAGGQNSQIVNNTVIHAFGQAGVFPWIRVSRNRDGRPSLNVTVANNITTSMKASSDPSKAIAVTNNVVVTNASAEFTAVSKQDFTLRSTAKGVDAGAPALAPKDDIVGAARPKGKAPDAGAYENF